MSGVRTLPVQPPAAVPTAICPNCGGTVRAIEDEMHRRDLQAFQAGKRPKYAMHADCLRASR